MVPTPYEVTWRGPNLLAKFENHEILKGFRETVVEFWENNTLQGEQRVADLRMVPSDQELRFLIDPGDELTSALSKTTHLIVRRGAQKQKVLVRTSGLTAYEEALGPVGRMMEVARRRREGNKKELPN